MPLKEEVASEKRLILHGVIGFQLMRQQEMWSVNNVIKYWQDNLLLKLHLAWTSKDIGACITIPEDVKKLRLGFVY